MTTKTIFLTILFGITTSLYAQVDGNVNYESKLSGNVNYGGNQYQVSQQGVITTTSSNQDEMYMVIRGLYNEKATSYLATFSLLQLGKTAEETTSLLDERINNVKNELKKSFPTIELVTDMISFVPTYGFSVEKKIFNPKTYNEKPSGFELKKNLIIKYNDANELDKIISVCAQQEIYDLAKVDYATKNYDEIRNKLQTKALEEYNEMLKNYSVIMNTDLVKKEKIVGEGFNITYPVESYKSYQAFSQAQLPNYNGGIVNQTQKNVTQYYDAVQIKSHAFVMNAELSEPSIQVHYELTVRIKLKEDQLPKNTIIKNNRYYIITANGDIKPLNL